MMKVLPALAALCCAWSVPVSACDKLLRLPQEQFRETVATMSNGRADELDRLEAYQTASCVEDVNLRDLVHRRALQPAMPPSIRGRALLDTLAARRNFIVEFGPAPQSDRETQVFVERNNGSMSFPNRFVDRSTGCISLADTNRCASNTMQIQGGRVELSYNNESLIGTFQIDQNGALVGQIKRARGAFIPARIALFN